MISNVPVLRQLKTDLNDMKKALAPNAADWIMLTPAEVKTFRQRFAKLQAKLDRAIELQGFS